MSILINCDKLLKVYTNKNVCVFESGSKKAYKYLQNGLFGIIFDDYNPNIDVINNFKNEYPNMTIYKITPLKKTLKIDDKFYFSNVMSESSYTPKCYKSKLEVDDKDALYFIKDRGGTGGRKVHIFTYNELLEEDINFRKNVVQKCCFNNPDLYNNRNYKIRQLALIHNKDVYLHKESWFSISEIDYNDENVLNRRFKYVINQRKDVKFELSHKLTDFSLIFENIKLAINDFKKYYKDDIYNFEPNEYSILGFDFVVNDKKDIQIIEINHRPCFLHPLNVREICDIGFIKDMIILLANKNLENTKFIKI